MSNPSKGGAAVITYYGDIYPLFRPMDAQCMRNPQFPTGTHASSTGPVLLLDYNWLADPAGNSSSQSPYYPDHANANNVYDHLRGYYVQGGVQQPVTQMPDGGPYWDASNIALFKAWMDGGYQKGVDPDAP